VALAGTSLAGAVAVVVVILLAPLGESSFNPPSPDIKFPYWTEAKPMPSARTEVAGAAIDMDIYVIGGLDKDGSAVPSVDVYDSVSDSWSSAPQLPVALHHAAAASSEGKLYVVGGYFAKGTASNKLFVYDPATNLWEELASMPQARGALTAQFVNGTLYAVGGASGEFGQEAMPPLALNEAYDPSTDSWAARKPMPTPRQHLASAVFDDKLLYVMGGRIDDLSSNLDANEVYDPANDEWKALAPMPSKRGGLAAAASNTDGAIYVFGGEELAGTIRRVDRYGPDDDSDNVWETAPELPNGRHGLAAVTAGSNIYVMGGGPRPGLSTGDFNQVLHTRYMVQ
jgi:N-acetylneuraminic acid mutarotase